jgi:hypothetical protein
MPAIPRTQLRRTLVALLVGTLVGCLGLASPAAAAQTDEQKQIVETLERWGLMGAWSLDCSQPPSSDNGYLAYGVQDGVAVHTRDFGDAQDENEVQEATLKPDGSIEIVVHFEGFDQTRKYVMIRKNDQIRAWSNTLADNTGATIAEGKFVTGGGETPWQSQCPMEVVPDGGQNAMEPPEPRK